MSSLAPVLASSNRSDSDYRTSVQHSQSGTAQLVQTATQTAEASKKKDVAPPATGSLPAPAAPKNASATEQTTLPLTVLLTVNQPTTSNAQASMDYQAMESDLRWGNLTAAQEVYIRLQNDLIMSREPISSSKEGSTAATATDSTATSQKHAGGELNTTA